MTLGVINQIWLEKVGKQWGIPPERLQAGIIRMLRERDELGIQKIEDWLSAGGQASQESEKLLEELLSTQIFVEGAVESVHYFCKVHEAERNRASTSGTEK